VTDYIVIVAAGALVVLLLTELVAAALPVVIVIAMVPPEEREGLARVLAACDSSRKLRLWPALRLAVRARREEAQRVRTGNRRQEVREALGVGPEPDHAALTAAPAMEDGSLPVGAARGPRAPWPPYSRIDAP